MQGDTAQPKLRGVTLSWDWRVNATTVANDWLSFGFFPAESGGPAQGLRSHHSRTTHRSGGLELFTCVSASTWGRAVSGAQPRPASSQELIRRNSSRAASCGNDPSAGSPTETLLRLHLPLNANVWTTFHSYVSNEGDISHSPKASREHSIGRCDGRCVQRAGT